MDVRITVDDREIMQRLTRLPRGLDDALLAGTEDASALYLREMRVYPPQRAGSLYRRTGTLGRSWFRQVQRVPGGARGEIFSNGNMAPYNIRVQKAGLQARVHQGRWQTDEAVAERLRPQIVRFYEVRVAQAANR